MVYKCHVIIVFFLLSIFGSDLKATETIQEQDFLQLYSKAHGNITNPPIILNYGDELLAKNDHKCCFFKEALQTLNIYEAAENKDGNPKLKEEAKSSDNIMNFDISMIGEADCVHEYRILNYMQFLPKYDDQQRGKGYFERYLIHYSQTIKNAIKGGVLTPEDNDLFCQLILLSSFNVAAKTPRERYWKSKLQGVTFPILQVIPPTIDDYLKRIAGLSFKDIEKDNKKNLLKASSFYFNIKVDESVEYLPPIFHIIDRLTFSTQPNYCIELRTIHFKKPKLITSTPPAFDFDHDMRVSYSKPAPKYERESMRNNICQYNLFEKLYLFSHFLFETFILNLLYQKH